MKIGRGLDIAMDASMIFQYGPLCFGPDQEFRKLDEIRASLLDRDCTGPEIVYAIAMDVGKTAHRAQLRQMMLLFGVVGYATGRLGKEPVRSQGHVHRRSLHSGWSPPEVYEIWEGQAIVYMQEFVTDDPGRCFAIAAKKGDIIMVPPGWAHATISADVAAPLVFGAWCDREYKFDYEQVRARRGLAWYPLLDTGNNITWKVNECYRSSELIIKNARTYEDFGIEEAVPIYRQFEADPGRFQFVSRPWLMKDRWKHFVP